MLTKTQIFITLHYQHKAHQNTNLHYVTLQFKAHQNINLHYATISTYSSPKHKSSLRYVINIKLTKTQIFITLRYQHKAHQTQIFITLRYQRKAQQNTNLH